MELLTMDWASSLSLSRKELPQSIVWWKMVPKNQAQESPEGGTSASSSIHSRDLTAASSWSDGRILGLVHGQDWSVYCGEKKLDSAGNVAK